MDALHVYTHTHTGYIYTTGTVHAGGTYTSLHPTQAWYIHSIQHRHGTYTPSKGRYEPHTHTQRVHIDRTPAKVHSGGEWVGAGSGNSPRRRRRQAEHMRSEFDAAVHLPERSWVMVGGHWRTVETEV